MSACSNGLQNHLPVLVLFCLCVSGDSVVDQPPSASCQSCWSSAVTSDSHRDPSAGAKNQVELAFGQHGGQQQQQQQQPDEDGLQDTTGQQNPHSGVPHHHPMASPFMGAQNGNSDWADGHSELANGQQQQQQQQ